jgi:hypothetical protein
MSNLSRNLRQKIVDTAYAVENNGTVYYVDGNSGVDTNSGKSWKQAFKTLAVGFAASHADIARGSDRWARRNTVYIAGDSFEEDLIILPQKTDVIGVGSYNGHEGPNILGNHAPVNSGFGCRFYNVNFEPVTAAVIMTLTNACWGAEFHGCTFRADGTLVATIGILTTGTNHLRIIGNNFLGGFTTSAIGIAAGAVDDMIIKDNIIIGSDSGGIVVSGTTTVTGKRKALIANNYVCCDDVGINDGADSTFYVINNRVVSAGALGATSHVITAAFATGNIVTGNGVQISIPAMTGVGA